MLHTQHNALSESEIISQAKEAFGELYGRIGQPGELLAALEAFYMNGFHDGLSGDAETFGHFYRVHRWIVWTDDQGFNDIETFDTEAQAIKAFEKYDKEYAATFNVGECF